MTWAHDELRYVDLGDKRLDRRLPRLVDAFYARAEASLPQTLPRWADAKAAYRFFDNDRVTPAALFDAQARATADRLAGLDRVLAVQDTTAIDYTHHPDAEGLGYLDRAFLRGFLLHSTLAVTTDGVPLGLLGGHLWARPVEDLGKKHARAQRPTAEKESARWLDAERHTARQVPAGVEVVTVADREADIYDLFAQDRPDHAHLLVRAAQNRRTDGDTLFDRLTGAPAAGTYTATVGRRGKKPSRQARLTVRFCEADVLAPRRANASKPAVEPSSVRVRAVEAVEDHPPAEEEAVHWRLVTTLPVGSFAEAQTVIGYYSRRWLIERYHLVLKSGCRVEGLQLETAARLERAVATLTAVAWRLLYVTLLARSEPESSCEQVLSAPEWQSLCAVQQGRVPSEAPTLREAVVLIACLGGFLNRRSDGAPGVQVLWRGLRRLSDISATWALAQNYRPPPLVGNE
jgi:hypothetical protein